MSDLTRSDDSASRRGPTNWMWIAFVAIASIALSRAFACAMPFAALSTLAALTFRRRESVALVLFAWIANQAVGFGLLHYPWTWSTLAWGLAIGAAALASLAAARQVIAAADRVAVAWWLKLPAGFIASFLAYESTLVATALLMSSGLEAFSLPIVSRILLINALALTALLIVDRLCRAVSTGWPRSAKARLWKASAT